MPNFITLPIKPKESRVDSLSGKIKKPIKIKVLAWQ